MKKILILGLIIWATILLYAQNPLAVGQNQFNAGVGFSSWGVPVYAGFDFGVHPNVTLGIEVSYQSFHEDWRHNRYRHSVVGISGNGNFHFNNVIHIPRNWDFYAGLNVGFYIWNSPDAYEGDHTTGLDLGAQVGGRYYPSENFGINLEFGGGNAFSDGKIGVSFKL